jgi:hypothetical protein
MQQNMPPDNGMNGNGDQKPGKGNMGMTPSCAPGMTPDSCMRGDGDDIKCRINNVLARNQALMDTLTSQLGNCSSADRHCTGMQNNLKHAQNSQMKAMKANGRAKGTDYDDLNTLRKEKCNSSKKSDCASGNGTYSGGESDSTLGQDLADHLDDATQALTDANDSLNQSASSMSLRARLLAAKPPSTFEALYDFSLDGDFPHALHPLESDSEAKLLTGARFLVSMAALELGKAREITEDECKQEVVVAGEGGNASSFCTPLTIAWVVAENIDHVLEFADDNQVAWEVHGAYEREGNLNDNLGQVDNDVAAVSAGVGNTQTEVTQLQAQVSALQASVSALQAQLSEVSRTMNEQFYTTSDMNKHIMKLLLSPDGNRSFPASLLTCTGDGDTSSPCPAADISCSTDTGLCSFNPK